jgi:glycosyltransferase involved in cell wall biosynthesis
MISVIICSINNTLLQNCKTSIQNTIGVPYEIIAADNSIHNFGICKVYNDGARKAQFNILCFVHEDISFNTPGWGEALINNFKITGDAIMGVAGTKYLSKVAAPWGAPDGDAICMNIMQNNNGRKWHDFKNPLNETLSEVVVIDGVFIATTKKIFDKTPFNENLLSGFHAYDLNFCLENRGSCKIYVAYNILLTHYSLGSYDAAWLKAQMKANRHFTGWVKGHIESFQPSLTKKQAAVFEKNTYKSALRMIAKTKHIPCSLMMKWCFTYPASAAINTFYTLKYFFRAIKYRIGS